MILYDYHWTSLISSDSVIYLTRLDKKMIDKLGIVKLKSWLNGRGLRFDMGYGLNGLG